MNSKDIKFTQYYRVGLKSYITNSVYYVIGYFINRRETKGFLSSINFYYFHDMGMAKSVGCGKPYAPDRISQNRYHICVDEIMSLEEINEEDLEKELFINGL